MLVRRGWIGLAPMALVAACGTDVVVVDGPGAGSGGATSTGATSAGPTTVVTSVGSSVSTSGAGGGDCCAAAEVLRAHDCIPTTALGCGASCSEGSCPEGWRCDDCAASGPCGEEICRPACVVDEAGPGGGIEEGDLRITPTNIDAGEPTYVSVLGVPLYVGALWYGVRVGADAEHTLEGGVTGGPCEQAFLSEALTAGSYPVWVSQYGGADPWVLAGILTVGGPPPSCAQPGYPCAAPSDCCQAPGAAVVCESGHCLPAGN